MLCMVLYLSHFETFYIFELLFQSFQWCQSIRVMASDLTIWDKWDIHHRAPHHTGRTCLCTEAAQWEVCAVTDLSSPDGHREAKESWMTQKGHATVPKPQHTLPTHTLRKKYPKITILAASLTKQEIMSRSPICWFIFKSSKSCLCDVKPGLPTNRMA